ncbi:hypothetical protein CC86DRAFT_371168 [Ophiobolus disseminans]|uniref:Uncharacterized protein n=1 Tax=Ophiobolus disseminans TaxID=1469910 RepID=A0A6A6ZVH1_9PLEO|nr:hypothetical protein CC86DRAFT_371168 [Ophiobolus disseminans]
MAHQLPSFDPTAPTTSFHQFSKLPTELKIQILGHRLRVPTKLITVEDHVKNLKKLLPVTLVSKELKDLAYTVYYTGNWFAIGERTQRQ